MKKIIALGDTHGRDNWRTIVSQNMDADKIIFIGDYFDSGHGLISARNQIENFQNILEFKKRNFDKVVLLFGNHDFHYLGGVKEQYSGYQSEKRMDIQEIITWALIKNAIQMCFIHDKFLFVHAGVTKTWCKENGIDLGNIQNEINDLFKYNPLAFRFTPGERHDKHGDDIIQSPIWVRPRSLYVDKIDNYIQVVGHTTMDSISGLNGSRKIHTDGKVVETSDVIFIDTLGTSGEYLKIINGIARPEKIK